MKTRQCFVSNSSSSSFVLIGEVVDSPKVGDVVIFNPNYVQWAVGSVICDVVSRKDIGAIKDNPCAVERIIRKCIKGDYEIDVSNIDLSSYDLSKTVIIGGTEGHNSMSIYDIMKEIG